MAWALKAHNITDAAVNNTTVTSGALDTTGADLIVVCVQSYGDVTPLAAWMTDSKGNTWNVGNTYVHSPADVRETIYWCNPTTVGAAHTFTFSHAGNATYPCIGVSAWSGSSGASSLDVQNGAADDGSNHTTRQTGSVTPGQTAELMVTGVSINSDLAGNYALDSSFTKLDDINTSGGKAVGGAHGYKIKTDSLAENPTWSWGGANVRESCAIMTFKPVAAAGQIIYVASEYPEKMDSWKKVLVPY